MDQTCSRAMVALATAMIVLAGGCERTRTAARRPPLFGSPDARFIACPAHEGLVLPTATMLELAGGETIASQSIDGVAHWEYGRRDDRLGAPGRSADGRLLWLEIRHREHLRTSNGRVREHTTTRSRSIERAFITIP